MDQNRQSLNMQVAHRVLHVDMILLKSLLR